MSTCSNCGVTLAGQAQYCMQCGTPVDAPRPAGATEQSDFIQPAIIAGAVLGILSSLPIVSAGNWCCCMWIVGGGALGAWMLARERPGGVGAMSYGDGAFVGVLSGELDNLVRVLQEIVNDHTVVVLGDRFSSNTCVRIYPNFFHALNGRWRTLVDASRSATAT